MFRWPPVVGSFLLSGQILVIIITTAVSCSCWVCDHLLMAHECWIHVNTRCIKCLLWHQGHVVCQRSIPSFSKMEVSISFLSCTLIVHVRASTIKALLALIVSTLQSWSSGQRGQARGRSQSATGQRADVLIYLLLCIICYHCLDKILKMTNTFSLHSQR